MKTLYHPSSQKLLGVIVGPCSLKFAIRSDRLRKPDDWTQGQGFKSWALRTASRYIELYLENVPWSQFSN